MAWYRKHVHILSSKDQLATRTDAVTRLENQVVTLSPPSSTASTVDGPDDVEETSQTDAVEHVQVTTETITIQTRPTIHVKNETITIETVSPIIDHLINVNEDSYDQMPTLNTDDDDGERPAKRSRVPTPAV